MEEEIFIERFSKKGWGIGKIASGKSVEVPHSVIGDTLAVALSGRRKKGRIQEVLTPSRDRIKPPCEHATICGGCIWQQMDYSAQLRYKQGWIQELFGEIPSVEIYPIEGASPPFLYRNKMEFSFGQNAGGQKYLGLMIAGASNYVFDVKRCHLVQPWFSQVLARVRAWFFQGEETAFTPRNLGGNLRTLTLREGIKTGDRLLLLTVNGPIQEEAFLEATQDLCPNIVLRTQRSVKNQPTTFSEKVLLGKGHLWEEMEVEGKRFRFKVSPTAFFQPNTKQAEKLYAIALSYIDPGEFVCDLYSGTGTIACMAASKAKRVFAIEKNPDAVKDALENFTTNGIDHVDIYSEEVGDRAHKLPRVDTVIIDPPRAGLDPKALSFLESLSPKKILYISCNPSTQKENVLQLIQNGYILKKLHPIDQFPHTYHLETVAYLEKK